jgi:OFA family oxalate/formate antiporter-like MFS transporter
MAFNVGQAEVGRPLFLLLVALGLFMYFSGRWQEKIGPGWLTAMGGALGGMSTIVLGYASSMNLVYLWGFLIGVSNCCIFIPTLTVAQRWYPHRRGLVSGLVNMAFGLGAALVSPIFSRMLSHMGYVSFTFIVGLISLVIVLCAAPFVRFPKAQDPSLPAAASEAQASAPSMTLSQSVRTRAFWLIWFTWALAGAAGIAMVNLSTSFGLAKGLTMQGAVLILTAFNLTNGLSRILSGYLSDVFGRNITMTLAFLAAGFAYPLLCRLEGLYLWAIMAAAVGFAFGTLFAVSVPLVSDCFGLEHFGSIFGLIFTAYGFVAGALGPWLSGHILDATQGDFNVVFTYLGIFCFISALLVFFARPPVLQKGL